MLLLWVPHQAAGTGAISMIASQHWLNPKLIGTGIVQYVSSRSTHLTLGPESGTFGQVLSALAPARRTDV
jgi:hypothetical protein